VLYLAFQYEFSVSTSYYKGSLTTYKQHNFQGSRPAHTKISLTMHSSQNSRASVLHCDQQASVASLPSSLAHQRATTLSRVSESHIRSFASSSSHLSILYPFISPCEQPLPPQSWPHHVSTTHLQGSSKRSSRLSQYCQQPHRSRRNPSLCGTFDDREEIRVSNKAPREAVHRDRPISCDLQDSAHRILRIALLSCGDNLCR
jgi:hypothetical protein